MLPGGRRCLHSASTAAQACFHHAAGAADTGTLGLTDQVRLSSWYSECLQTKTTGSLSSLWQGMAAWKTWKRPKWKRPKCVVLKCSSKQHLIESNRHGSCHELSPSGTAAKQPSPRHYPLGNCRCSWRYYQNQVFHLNVHNKSVGQVRCSAVVHPAAAVTYV